MDRREMNCEECKDLISFFVDNDLGHEDASGVRDHLALCESCAVFCGEVSSMIEIGLADAPLEAEPPNSKALWCRINNVIENEISTRPPAVEPPKPRWQFSLVQAFAAILCVGVISSLITFVAIKNYSEPNVDEFGGISTNEQTPFERALVSVGLMRSPNEARLEKLKEQQQAIDYWNARVQARRSQWSRTTREAFDRNINVIDESVNEYRIILQANPDDELSGEMLDAVMTEKMNLLRDFAEL